jgi:hypothetical protein
MIFYCEGYFEATTDFAYMNNYLKESTKPTSLELRHIDNDMLLLKLRCPASRKLIDIET